MKIVAMVSWGLFLAGCVTNEVITGPDGTPHHLVNCYSIKGCYQKATHVCGGKYQIVNTSNEVSGSAERTSSETHLLVKCKNNKEAPSLLE